MNQTKVIGSLLAGVAAGLTIGMFINSNHKSLKPEKVVHLLTDLSRLFDKNGFQKYQALAFLLDKASQAIKSSKSN